MLSVGHHQFVELFNTFGDVLHEGLLNISVKETVGEHEIHPPVLQNRGEDFPYTGSQCNWPHVPRLCLSCLFQEQMDYNVDGIVAGVVEIKQGREEGGTLLQVSI